MPVTTPVTEAPLNLREHCLRKLQGEILAYLESSFATECEAKGLQGLGEYWNEVLNHCERILKAAHAFRETALTDRWLTCLEAGLSLEEMAKLPKFQPRTDGPVVDLRKLRAQLPESGKGLETRAFVALSVVDVVIDEINGIQTEVSGPSKTGLEPCWPWMILSVCNGNFEVCQPWKSGDNPAFEGHMWRAILRVSEEGDTLLAERVQALEPPLTWGEAFYHFLRSLQDHKGEPASDRRRLAISEDMFAASQTYCLECDRLFTVDNRHPGRFVCPRCRARDRKRRERQRNQQATPAETAKGDC